MAAWSSEAKIRIAGGLVLLAVCAAYANSFGNAFHFDDFHTITENPAVRRLTNVPRFFTDTTTFSVLPANRTYRPVVSASLALDYALGKGYKPFAFHLSTFCWFLLLLWLLFRLYRTLFERSGAGDAGAWLALFATAWFGLHPAVAETINYVIQRGDLYCTLGCVAALAVYARYPQRRRTGLYLVPLVLALLSKPPASVFPALLFLWVYFFERQKGLHSARRWRTCLMAALPSLLVVVALLALQGSMTPKTFTPTILSTVQYRLTQPYVWIRYGAELLLPLHLNVDTDLAPFHALNGRALLGFFFVAALLLAIERTARRRELYPIGFGLLWFVVTQLPTSLYPLSEVENDHRMFFSFAGLIPAVVWALWLVLQRAFAPQTQRHIRPLLIAVAALLLAGYGWGVHARNEVWRTEESLWRDDVEKSPRNGRGLMIYGLTQMNKGSYAAALVLYNRALQYTPNYATLEINLAVAHGALGDQAAAERHFQRAVALAPEDDQPRAYYGRWLLAEGRAEDAVAQLRTAIALNPTRMLQRQLLLAALQESGDPEGEQQAAREARAAFPADPAASVRAQVQKDTAYWVNRSLALNLQARYRESIAAAQEALRLNASSAEAWNNIAADEGSLHAWDEAVDAARRAIALKPDFQLAKNNLAWSEHQKKLSP